MGENNIMKKINNFYLTGFVIIFSILIYSQKRQDKRKYDNKGNCIAPGCINTTKAKPIKIKSKDLINFELDVPYSIIRNEGYRYLKLSKTEKGAEYIMKYRDKNDKEYVLKYTLDKSELKKLADIIEKENIGEINGFSSSGSLPIGNFALKINYASGEKIEAYSHYGDLPNMEWIIKIINFFREIAMKREPGIELDEVQYKN